MMAAAASLSSITSDFKELKACKDETEAGCCQQDPL